MSKFKHCPFCGMTSTLKVYAASELWDYDNNGDFPHGESYAVFCDASDEARNLGCGASSGHELTEEKAIEAWNRRL